MIFIFGILSLIQSILLPGMIIKQIYFKNIPFLIFLPFCFAISLIITWIIIFWLTFFGLYTKFYILFVILFEIIIFLYLYRRVKFFKGETLNLKDYEFSFLQILNTIFVSITFYSFISHFGEIYQSYDAIVSYNGRLAGSWFNNHFPTESLIYPQLLTSNMSLSNVLTGLNTNEMQFFSFILCLCFIPFTSLVAGSVVKFTSNNFFYLPNIILLSMLNFSPLDNGDKGLFYKIISYNGYMDIPVMCMIVISIGLFTIAWFSSKRTSNDFSTKIIILSSAVAAGALATKQSGIIFVPLTFLAIWYWCSSLKIPYSIIIWKVLILHFIIYGNWYLYYFFHVYNDTNGNEISIIFSQLDTLSYIERVQRAFKYFPEFYFMSLITIPLILNKKYFFIPLIIFFNLTIWTLYFSFDLRNFILTYPLIAIGISIIIYHPLRKIRFLNKIIFMTSFFRLNFKINKFYLLSSLCLFFTLFLFYSTPTDKKLLDKNEYLRRLIMPIEYSEAIYKAWDKYGIGRIITSQKHYIARLPRMIPYVVEPYDFQAHTEKNYDYFNYLIYNSDAKYILISKHEYFQPNLIIQDKINKMSREKMIKLVSEEGSVKVYIKINNF